MRSVSPQCPAEIFPAIPWGHVNFRLHLRRVIETRPNLLHEGDEARLVENPCCVFFEVVAESVGVIVHPTEQTGRDLIRIGAICLPGLDPSAEQPVNAIAEAAARIVELLSLLIAAGKKRFVQRDGSGRIGVGQLRDPGRNLIEAAHERKGRPVGDKDSGVECLLYRMLERIGVCARLPCHQSSFFRHMFFGLVGNFAHVLVAVQVYPGGICDVNASAGIDRCSSPT